MIPLTARERRRRQRIVVALPIKIEYNGVELSATTINISMLGTYLNALEEIPTGGDLLIRIKVPKVENRRIVKTQEIKCLGTAFRCQSLSSPKSEKQYGVAIFFRSFLEEGEEALLNYINYILWKEKEKGKIYIRKRKRKYVRRKGGKP